MAHGLFRRAGFVLSLLLEAAPAPSHSAGTVTLTVVTTRGGTVRSDVPRGFECRGICTTELPVAARVDLRASADVGADFVGWGGACYGTARICAVILPQAGVVVRATFRARPSPSPPPPVRSLRRPLRPCDSRSTSPYRARGA